MLNRKKYFIKEFLIILMLLSLILLAGCAKKECRRDNDCMAKSCLIVSCVENKCIDTPKCSGKYVLQEKGQHKLYAKYLEKMCDEETNKCYWGVDENSVTTFPLVTEKDILGFTLELGATFKKPFDLAKDKVEISLILKDFEDSIANLPLTIKKIQVLAGDIKYGELIINKDINNIGGEIKEYIPLTFRPEKRETEAILRLKIDYEYEKIISDALETERGTLQHSFSQKIFFVITGDVNV